MSYQGFKRVGGGDINSSVVNPSMMARAQNEARAKTLLELGHITYEEYCREIGVEPPSKKNSQGGASPDVDSILSSLGIPDDPALRETAKQNLAKLLMQPVGDTPPVAPPPSPVEREENANEDMERAFAIAEKLASQRSPSPNKTTSVTPFHRQEVKVSPDTGVLEIEDDFLLAEIIDTERSNF